MKMCKSKIEVRSKKRIRVDLETEVERDGTKRGEVMEKLGEILAFCKVSDVQPETFLLELSRVRSIAVKAYMIKHQKQVASVIDRKPSPKDIKMMRKDFNRALGQIERLGAKRSCGQNAGDKSEDDGQKSERTDNEDMPYQPSNERPYYIN